MAHITINEISQNYSYAVSGGNYATVAMPIASCWGPGYFDYRAYGYINNEPMLEQTKWELFPSTQAGLEKFISTYRGPSTMYRAVEDYSYQMALTLLAEGYNILTCRVSPGMNARSMPSDTVTIVTSGSNKKHVYMTAKYPGSFGNTLLVSIKKSAIRKYWNLIIYTIDSSGIKTALENLVFVFEEENTTDQIPHWKELKSEYIILQPEKGILDTDTLDVDTVQLANGADYNMADGSPIRTAMKLASDRYTAAGYPTAQYIFATQYLPAQSFNMSMYVKHTYAYKEWLYNAAIDVYELLTDRVAYNPNRVISPGWDDQNFKALLGNVPDTFLEVSPIHIKLMDVAYRSRCATAYIDIPRSLPRNLVYNDSHEVNVEGYAQKLARLEPPNGGLDEDSQFYSTHSALCVPWDKYRYVGTKKLCPASPSFQALMLQRDMIKNQSVQYEWVLPSSRRTSLSFVNPEYNISNKLLDEWQSEEGVAINIITNIPQLGTTLWGNSTLYETPPATYQALANLSTRLIFNAIKDVIYRVGIGITFTYNNADAYGVFYAGVTPILDTMKNVGAITGYEIKINEDLNASDRVNYNSVVGIVSIAVQGVVRSIHMDLVALPPNYAFTATR